MAKKPLKLPKCCQKWRFFADSVVRQSSPKLRPNCFGRKWPKLRLKLRFRSYTNWIFCYTMLQNFVKLNHFLTFNLMQTFRQNACIMSSIFIFKIQKFPGNVELHWFLFFCTWNHWIHWIFNYILLFCCSKVPEIADQSK